MPGLVDGTVADGTVAGMAADGAGPAGVGALAGAGAAGDGDPASASPLVHLLVQQIWLGALPLGLSLKRLALARDCSPNHASWSTLGAPSEQYASGSQQPRDQKGNGDKQDHHEHHPTPSLPSLCHANLPGWAA